jgi:hypothetical protein
MGFGDSHRAGNGVTFSEAGSGDCDAIIVGIGSRAAGSSINVVPSWVQKASQSSSKV